MEVRFIISVLLVLLIAQQALAQNVITLSPSKDNTLYEDDAGALSNGAGDHLFVGTINEGLFRRALLYFDVANALPNDAVIDSVRLTLNMSRTASGTTTITIHPVTSAWGEGTSDASAEEGQGAAPTPDDATWIHSFFDTAFWQSPGGDFRANASAQQTVNRDGKYVWGSTPEMIADVQSWVDTPQSNRGWILVGDETTENSAKRFDSKDHANAGVRPRLEISFTGTPTAATRDVVPDLAYLEGNYPNPFQSQTTILYTLDKPQHVILELIDLQGRIIQTLIHTDQSAGLHQIRLEANELPGGVYLCRLTTETSSRYQKLVLQK